MMGLRLVLIQGLLFAGTVLFYKIIQWFLAAACSLKVSQT